MSAPNWIGNDPHVITREQINAAIAALGLDPRSAITRVEITASGPIVVERILKDDNTRDTIPPYTTTKTLIGVVGQVAAS
ncbi:hypothetical protein [Gordonia sp. OPL2]|uniref:hypothetical protein n=1 Tax=Gordonia sp. OPL2 TaxID=2486274 RepID=UPI0016565032|nr:hypothetical protein [Gordonia sp. OPL2]ROZ88976.1 hypothetical protein EEB19_19900 [Gordonia sp. OPL2]